LQWLRSEDIPSPPTHLRGLQWEDFIAYFILGSLQRVVFIINRFDILFINQVKTVNYIH